jgi:uncharacterized membrane protein (DUF373 family)
MAKKVQTFSQKAERFIIYALVVMMATVLVLATIELAYHIIMAVITPPILLLNFDDILDLFGIFLLVLIGIELLDTIKIYFKRNIVHVEVVVLVAIIAISRKVIVLEVGDYPPGTLIGIALIIFALAICYFLIKRLGSEIINVKELPKSSQKVIREEIKDSKEFLTGKDSKLDISEGTGQQKNFDIQESPENQEKDDTRVRERKERDSGNENFSIDL